MCDNELQAIFHFNEKRNGWEGYHRLTDRERIFNFNSAINSSATRCAKSWKKASSHLPRLVVRDGNFDMRLPQPRRKTLSENYLRLRELISLAVEWATMCMWNIFSFLAFLITRFRLIPTSARGAQKKSFTRHERAENLFNTSKLLLRKGDFRVDRGNVGGAMSTSLQLSNEFLVRRKRRRRRLSYIIRWFLIKAPLVLSMRKSINDRARHQQQPTATYKLIKQMFSLVERLPVL